MNEKNLYEWEKLELADIDGQNLIWSAKLELMGLDEKNLNEWEKLD